MNGLHALKEFLEKSFYEKSKTHILIEFIIVYIVWIFVVILYDGKYEELVSDPQGTLYDVFMAFYVSIILLVLLFLVVLYVSGVIEFGLNIRPFSEEKRFRWIPGYLTTLPKLFLYYSLLYIPLVSFSSAFMTTINFTAKFSLGGIILSAMFMLRAYKNLDMHAVMYGVIIGLILSGFILHFTGTKINPDNETGFEYLLFFMFAGLDMLFISSGWLPRNLDRYYNFLAKLGGGKNSGRKIN